MNAYKKKTPSIDNLLSIARKIISDDVDRSNLDETALVELVEQYSQTLDHIINNSKNSAGVLSEESLGLSHSQLEELSAIHALVITKAGGLLKQTAVQLKDLQFKAKGIMAYVDILPKKISVTKTRKG